MPPSSSLLLAGRRKRGMGRENGDVEIGCHQRSAQNTAGRAALVVVVARDVY